jgi:peptidoglycan/LPS O-acetylase OafA/YrhL
MRQEYRDEPLEAARGLAALVVVLWHLLLGFDPARPGALPGFPHALSWIGRPWYGLINGGGAVGFFFVLSGFVLTRRNLQRTDAAGLARGAIKRWPRLAGPVTVACLFCWVLFPLHLYRFQQAAAFSHSPWLAGFGYGMEGASVRPNAWHAFTEGAARTFFTGSTAYNSSLWTMRPEFWGSLIAFGLALALLHLPRPAAGAWLLGVAWVACFCVDPWLANFPLGVALAALAAAGRLPRLTLPAAIALLAAAYASACYNENSRLDAAIWHHLHAPLPGATVYGLGAALVLVALEGSPALRQALSGRVPRALGRLSFPLYLLHLPILLSFGCMAYLGAGAGHAGMAAAAAVTLPLTLLAAWPLARFDVWWTARVNRAAALALRAPEGSAAVPDRVRLEG